ncbi:tetraacyldisaccharide 4'-kinase [Pseudodesulfovibrio sp. JC047]|uniref:tetraacyldisaccharide 4'-kinase n=1 Tax=Pseudodesulfovibrio sp. JC047 TaxID=2683199 RepID=UPI0013D194AD|nr:tetraacyldisaccharide 4'-kinase [Pseudodesulfovibrio sp. JC047]NDV18930.1 tetraacyldisaccharide 4'-kinase [Pseudodesulfovibrio sp. JC047]
MSESVIDIQKKCAPVLKPAASVYGRVMRVREAMYARGMLRHWEPPVPTVSVGNIGWGGTGKTPVADWLLGWAEIHRLKSVLLTRGYGAHPPSVPYLVRPESLAESAGDEPLMLARSHARAHILVDPQRIRAGKLAMKRFSPDVMILDDGFQHMAVARHCNLVLLKPEDVGSGWNQLIPAGSWREPASALARADAFMLKISPSEFETLTPALRQRLGAFGKPVFSFQIKPTGVRPVRGGEAVPDFDSASYLLVSGVGDPAQVKETATRYLGYPPTEHMIFKDHHPYSQKDALAIADSARKAGCEAVLCTPKDAVKLGPLCSEAFWEFDLQLAFGPSLFTDGVDFEAWWTRQFNDISTRLVNKAHS